MSSVLNVFLHGAVCTYINILYSSHRFWKAKIYWFENKIMTTMISCPEQSRKCPLCTRQIGAYLIHHIRSNLDFQKYYLPPQSTSPLSSQQSRQESRVLRSRRTAQSRRWGRTERISVIIPWRWMNSWNTGGYASGFASIQRDRSMAL